MDLTEYRAGASERKRIDDLNEAQKAFRKRHPNWIRVLFKKRLAPE